MTCDELNARVRERKMHAPWPAAVLLNPADWDELAREIWNWGSKDEPERKPIVRIEARGIPVLPLNDVPPGTYAWQMTAEQEP